MEEFYKALDDVISCIKEMKEYKMCISIQEQMKDHSTITELIKKVKDTQKRYIKSGYDSKIKKELDSYQEELMNIPIYSIYLKNLEFVNERIEYVKDSLNDYFYDLLNK